MDIGVSYVGDGLALGYPPGITPPDWLNVAFEPGATAGVAKVRLSVVSTNYPPPASFATIVRVVTGRSDGSNTSYADVSVSYNVTGPALQTSANPDSVQFLAADGGPIPAQKTLVLTFNGTSAGYDPASIPGWLQVTQQSGTSGQSVMALRPTGTSFSPGTNLSATVAFFTSRGGTGRVTTNVQVGYQVVTPLSVTPASFSYTLIKSSGQQPAPAGSRSIVISGDDLEWTASADQPWITLKQMSGSGAATLLFTLDGSKLALGDNQATITISNSTTGQTQKIPVDIQVAAPKLVASPTQATLDIGAQTTAAQAQAVVQLTDEIGGKDSSLKNMWSAESSVPWLSVTPSSGQVPPNGTLTIKAVPSQLPALSNGPQAGTITIHYSNADTTSATISVPVALNLSLPRVTNVTPYIATAGVSREVVLRGSGFTGVTLDQVLFGNAQGSALTVVNDGEIHLDNPALAAGTIPVAISNKLQISTQASSLTVLAPQVYAAAVIPSENRKKRLIYDAERAALYAVDDVDHTLKRFRYGGGSWIAEFISAPATIWDAAMSPDGKTLIVAAQAGIYKAVLGQEPLQFSGPYATSILQNGFYFPGSLQATNDGRLLVFDEFFGSGFAPLYIYDLATDAVTPLELPDVSAFIDNGASSARSADGTVIYFSSVNSSSGYRFNSGTSAIDKIQLPDLIQGLALSRNANRVAVDSYAVSDRTGATLGFIKGLSYTVSMSPDESLLYNVLVDFNQNPAPSYLQTYDLTKPVDSSGNFQIKRSVLLTTDPAATYANDVLTLVTEDGKTLFLSGTHNLQVIPLGP